MNKTKIRFPKLLLYSAKCSKSCLLSILFVLMTLAFIVKMQKEFKIMVLVKKNYPKFSPPKNAKKSSWNIDATDVCSKGASLFSQKYLLTELEEFIKVYDIRPVINSDFGNQIHHQFAMWTLIRKLKPLHVIESGVHKGMGTWIMRQAAPQAQFIMIEPKNITTHKFGVYIDHRNDSQYFMGHNFRDFNQIDWTRLNMDKNRTFVMFDDHQNHMRRIQESYNYGFKDLLFDDNEYTNIFNVKKACMALSNRLPTNFIVKDDFMRKSRPLDVDYLKYVYDIMEYKIDKSFEFPSIWKLHNTSNNFILDLNLTDFIRTYQMKRPAYRNMMLSYENIVYITRKILKGRMPLVKVDDLQYSEKYCDDYYEYRHVILPKDASKHVPRSHLMTESEWRNLGIAQSPGWEHYLIHQPEPHILMFRRLLPGKEPPVTSRLPPQANTGRVPTDPLNQVSTAV